MRLDKLNGIQVRLQNSELKKQNCAFTPQDECEKDFVQVLMLIESCSERKKKRGVGGEGGYQGNLQSVLWATDDPEHCHRLCMMKCSHFVTL